MDDFRKYATKHLGMNGMVLDDVIKSQAGYLNPYILEERQLNVTQLDVFCCWRPQISQFLSHYLHGDQVHRQQHGQETG